MIDYFNGNVKYFVYAILEENEIMKIRYMKFYIFTKIYIK